MKTKWFAVLLLPLLLCACGPIWGQLMRVSEGVGSAEQLSGPVQQLKSGARVLVYGPFPKTDAAYYICRGEEAAKFAEELQRHGLQSEAYLATAHSDAPTADAVRKMTPEQLRSALGLASAPDYLLFGTLLRREATVAPMRGVVMDEAYRLELLNLRAAESSRYEISVRSLAQETVGQVVDEFSRLLGLVVK